MAKNVAIPILLRIRIGIPTPMSNSMLFQQFRFDSTIFYFATYFSPTSIYILVLFLLAVFVSMWWSTTGAEL